MSNDFEPRTVLLASARSTYLVGPVSGLQLGAVLAAVVLPVFIAISQMPGWLFVVVLLWQLTLISAVRLGGRNGWLLLAGVWRTITRAKDTASTYLPPTDIADLAQNPLVLPEKVGKARALFAAAPGRLAKTTVLTTPTGDLFVLPRPGGQSKPGRVTAAWSVTGPGYALLPARDQETAIDAWAIAINRLAALPGIIGVSVHVRADSSTGLIDARRWHEVNADDSRVSVATHEYAELLATVDARNPACALAVTFDPRKVAGKIAGVAALVEEVPPILRNAGITVQQRLTAGDAIHAVLDVGRARADKPESVSDFPNAPVFPAFTDSPDMVSVNTVYGTHVFHSAVVAVTATSVGVGGDILAPLFTARPGVETALALTIRPLPPEQTQARSRARQVKLRRQRAAADSSSMTGMLIDVHKVDQELETLHALGADAARGSVETELVITVTITGDDATRVRTARAALVRDAAPLRFTTVAYPAPVVLFTHAPLGGLL